MFFDFLIIVCNRSDFDKLELCCFDQLINLYSFSLNNYFDGQMLKKWLNIFKFFVMIMILVYYFGKCIEKKKNFKLVGVFYGIISVVVGYLFDIIKIKM